MREEEQKEVKNPTIYLTHEDNKKTISVFNGESISVTIGNPGDGGYQFENPSYDKSLLVLKSHTHQNPTPRVDGNLITGDFGTDTWIFTSIKSGTTRISIDASRRWDSSSRTTLFSAIVLIK